MIPVHIFSTEYSVYDAAYRKHANALLSGDTSDDTVRKLFQSLFHYSFNVIPNQVKSTQYTPSSIAFYAPGLLAQGVRDLVTKVAEVSVSKNITGDNIAEIFEDALYPEVSKVLNWDAQLLRSVAVNLYVAKEVKDDLFGGA